MTVQSLLLDLLRTQFGAAVQENVPLAPHTSARIGGAADLLVTVKSMDELAQAISLLWEAGTRFIVLGGGSNVLVSDRGVREVVVLNKAKSVRFEDGGQPNRTGGARRLYEAIQRAHWDTVRAAIRPRGRRQHFRYARYGTRDLDRCAEAASN